MASFRGRENAIADLEVAEGVSLVAHDVPVKEGLDFTRLEGRELVSTIRGGQIVFPEVASEVAIEPRDYVDLKELERFFVRAVELDEGLRVSLHGVVGKFAHGTKRLPSGPIPVLPGMALRTTDLVCLLQRRDANRDDRDRRHEKDEDPQRGLKRVQAWRKE